MACKEQRVGGLSCPDPQTVGTPCSPFQLVKQEARNACYIERLTQEHLNIGGAQLNVYKLLGVHEQDKLIDVTGKGTAISSGSQPNHSPKEAFNIYCTQWRSAQLGHDEIITSAYIGYDFGELKLENGRIAYDTPGADMRYNVSALSIKQSCSDKFRATRLRVERSDDGKKWYGAAVVDVPNDEELNTVYFNKSVQSRYWRIRPVAFNGTGKEFWEVSALQLFEYEKTRSDNIQDILFQENRDRHYDTQAIPMKGQYDFQEAQTDLSRFGIEMQQQYQLNVGFSASVELLGRPIVVGDVIELPSEAMYDVELNQVRKFLEVSDVAWSSEGYTPGWTPTLLRVTAIPMHASQETADIFGGLDGFTDDAGLFSQDDGLSSEFQDVSAVSHEIDNESKTAVPAKGMHDGKIAERFLEDDELHEMVDKGVPTSTLAEPTFQHGEAQTSDALPPNGAEYTQGDAFPENPEHGVYHRLTYAGTASDIPTRLFRWSSSKNRWIFLEADKHHINSSTPVIDAFITNTYRP